MVYGYTSGVTIKLVKYIVTIKLVYRDMGPARKSREKNTESDYKR